MNITPESFNNRVLSRNGTLGQDACEIMAAAIFAVDPYISVISYFQEHPQLNNLLEGSRIFLIGFGKASVPMAKAMIDIYGDKLYFAKVITKDKKFKVDEGYKGKLEVYFGGHPVPTSDSISSTRAILSSFPTLSDEDVVFVLISGGGSALFTDPIEGITLDDLQILTKALLSSGADINEINTLRKHLDRVKGGRLALFLEPARCFSFILSDVIGNRIDMIASGPISPDPTTFFDAEKIIQKYDLKNSLPKSICFVLTKGIHRTIPETLKYDKDLDSRIRNVIIGSNIQALNAAKNHAEGLCYRSIIVSDHLAGSTESAAEAIFTTIQSHKSGEESSNLPICLIFGGETTVKLTGNGKGGRNQDLALRLSSRLANSQGVLFISLATDGEDGPTDAAGAVVDSKLYQVGERAGLDPKTFILDNNSYEYFDQMGGLIKTGATGTNVNDLMIALIDRPRTD